MNKKVTFQDLGLIDYKKCWQYQEALFEQILAIKARNKKSIRQKTTKNGQKKQFPEWNSSHTLWQCVSPI